MINVKNIEYMMRERGYTVSVAEGKEITKFIQMYYDEMIEWGVYLKDIEFIELNPDAKINLFESGLKLWITTNNKSL